MIRVELVLTIKKLLFHKLEIKLTKLSIFLTPPLLVDSESLEVQGGRGPWDFGRFFVIWHLGMRVFSTF